MKTAFIIHGAYGNPEENWIPWLKSGLEKSGYQVYVPQFPTPINQNLESWFKVIDPYITNISKDSILIGHSIGATFLLSILEKINKPVGAVFLVSGFTGKLHNPLFDTLNHTFSEKPFNWKIIRKNCRNFYLFHGDNDPYVPLQNAEELAEKLKSALIVIKQGGHFNKAAGYTKFRQLLEKIVITQSIRE